MLTGTMNWKSALFLWATSFWKRSLFIRTVSNETWSTKGTGQHSVILLTSNFRHLLCPCMVPSQQDVHSTCFVCSSPACGSVDVQSPPADRHRTAQGQPPSAWCTYPTRSAKKDTKKKKPTLKHTRQKWGGKNHPATPQSPNPLGAPAKTAPRSRDILFSCAALQPAWAASLSLYLSLSLSLCLSVSLSLSLSLSASVLCKHPSVVNLHSGGREKKQFRLNPQIPRRQMAQIWSLQWRMCSVPRQRRWRRRRQHRPAPIPVMTQLGCFQPLEVRAWRFRGDVHTVVTGGQAAWSPWQWRSSGGKDAPGRHPPHLLFSWPSVSLNWARIVLFTKQCVYISNRLEVDFTRLFNYLSFVFGELFVARHVKDQKG